MRRSLLIIAVLAVVFAVVPTARAQTDGRYAPRTGHTITDAAGILSFWLANDGEALLGLPVSEAFDVDGSTVQYFERGIIEQRGAAPPVIGRAGAAYVAALGRTLAPAPAVVANDGLRFATSGYSLRAPFLAVWQRAGGLAALGAPISAPAWELTPAGERQVQYFERGRLDRDPALTGTPAEITLGPIGVALARLRGVDLAPVSNPGYATVGPLVAAPELPALLAALPTATPTPEPTAEPLPEPTAGPAPEPAAPAAPAAPAPQRGGPRSITVNLSQQWLYAYEGQTLVFDAPVTTGRDGMQTPTGTYGIYAKLVNQTMSGTDANGPWVVPNVPHVMYINGGVALHGTYWHNLFGSGVRVSHGCINLPLGAAEWVYSWAGVGTPVVVTY